MDRDERHAPLRRPVAVILAVGIAGGFAAGGGSDSNAIAGGRSAVATISAAGPILRWHSNTVCKEGRKRGLKPPASGKCPPRARLTQGTSEMLHLWFTRDLRSAFAIRAPEPELCETGLLPKGYCRTI